MYDGEELPDIVRAVDRSEVEHAIARLQVYRLILHRPRITAASRIHRPGICPHLHW